MVKPLGDRIVVKKVELDRLLKSGILLPDSVREQSDRGVVVQVGPGSYSTDGTLIPMPPFEAGDVVVFSPYAGAQVIVGDDEYLILRVGDVLGILDQPTLAEAAAA